MPLTPKERRLAGMKAQTRIDAFGRSDSPATLTKPEMTPLQEARYDAAVAGHRAELEAEPFEARRRRHGFDPQPMDLESAKTAARIGGEMIVGVSPAGPAIDIRDLHQAWEEKDIGTAALAGVGLVPGVGDLAKGIGKAAKKGSARAARETAAQATRAERLWKEMGTESPYFKKWFGDSKVVDDTGKPQVLYHGTGSDFESFSDAHIGKTSDAGYYGRGFTFSTDPKIASHYAGKAQSRSKGAPSVMPVFVQAVKPLRMGADITKEPFFEEIVEIAEDLYFKRGLPTGLPALRKRVEAWRGIVFRNSSALMQQGSPWRAEAIREYALRNGHDSVIVSGRAHHQGAGEIIVFEPTQIKSATGNTGAFDPLDPDITASRETGPKTTQTA
jgi:hypothetical protein